METPKLIVELFAFARHRNWRPTWVIQDKSFTVSSYCSGGKPEILVRQENNRIIYLAKFQDLGAIDDFEEQMELYEEILEGQFSVSNEIYIAKHDNWLYSRLNTDITGNKDMDLNRFIEARSKISASLDC